MWVRRCRALTDYLHEWFEGWIVRCWRWRVRWGRGGAHGNAAGVDGVAGGAKDWDLAAFRRDRGDAELSGEVPERLNGPVSKTGSGATHSGVRIPPSPFPFSFFTRETRPRERSPILPRRPLRKPIRHHEWRRPAKSGPSHRSRGVSFESSERKSRENSASSVVRLNSRGMLNRSSGRQPCAAFVGIGRRRIQAQSRWGQSLCMQGRSMITKKIEQSTRMIGKRRAIWTSRFTS